MSVIDRIRGAVRAPISVGLLAQGLTVGSAFLPVVLGETDALVYLVQVSAAVAVLVATTTLSAMMLLPAIGDDKEANRYLAIVLTNIFAVTLLVFVSAFALEFAGAPKWSEELTFGGGFLLPLQALYMVLMADMVRSSDLRGVMLARVTYGSCLFASTLLACLLFHDGVALLAATCLALLAGSCFGLLRTRVVSRMRETGARTTFSRTSVAVAFRHGGVLSAAQVLAGLSTQAPGLIVPLLGPAAPFWAVVVRVVSGFQSIGGQLIAPRLDIRIAESMKLRSSRLLLPAFRQACEASFLLSLAASLAVLLALCWVGLFANNSELVVSTVVAGVVFAAGASGHAPIDHVLGLLGKKATRVGWDVARSGATFGIVIVSSGAMLSTALSLLWAISYSIYVIGALIAVIRLVREFEGMEQYDASPYEV